MTVSTTPNPCMGKLIAPVQPLIPNPSTPTTPIASPTTGAVIVNNTPDPAKTSGVYNLNVLQIAFIPLKTPHDDPSQALIDDSFIRQGGTLQNIRNRIDTMTQQTITALELGSHGEVTYRVFGRIEIQEKYPLTRGTSYKATGYNPPLVDYAAILKRIDIAAWVAKGVNQVWLHGPQNDDEHICWETLMSSQWGNISNSDQLTQLPTAQKPYIQLFLNVDTGAAEAVESYCHQIEHLLHYIDQQDNPSLPIKERLFWGKFCGAEREWGKPIAINGVYRCGWSHHQPNSISDYDWWINASRTVTSDMLDWRPEGGGQTQLVNRETFNNSGQDDGGLGFKIAWLRALPHSGNTLTYKGKKLTNWWRFLGDFDGAMKGKLRLTESNYA